MLTKRGEKSVKKIDLKEKFAIFKKKKSTRNEDIEKNIDIPIFASIPEFETETKMKNDLITIMDSKEAISEILRTLGKNIQTISNNKKIQTILITSPLSGEGKSWISANLAVVLAQEGKKVLIIDGDMRKGRQFSIFNVMVRPGLVNYLSDKENEYGIESIEDFRCIIKQTETENLYVMPAGEISLNDSELLINKRMKKLLLDLKQQFDFIIFDAPSVLSATEVTILSRMLDTTILVLSHQETKIDDLNKVKRAIENMDGNIAGVIINKVPIKGENIKKGNLKKVKELEKEKNSKPALYLRGKAAILEDRYKSKVISQNLDTEEKGKKENVQQELENTAPTKFRETQELIKRMREQIEEQKRQMSNMK